MSDQEFRFYPWVEAEEKFPVTLDDVKEPPCRYCRFFQPRAKTNNIGEFDGVVLCIANEMHHDFSCYQHIDDQSTKKYDII